MFLPNVFHRLRWFVAGAERRLLGICEVVTEPLPRLTIIVLILQLDRSRTKDDRFAQFEIVKKTTIDAVENSSHSDIKAFNWMMLASIDLPRDLPLV